MACVLYGASEPSAFGAGNLNSDSPYGLTSTEVAVSKNSKDIKNVEQQILKLSNRLDALKHTTEGVSSVVEGINDQTVKFSGDTNSIKNSILSNKTQIEAIDKKIAKIELSLEQIQKNQKDSYEKITTTLKEISSIIDSINNSYVSKKELENVLITKKNEELLPIEAKNNPNLMKEAIEFFDKKMFDNAEIRFEKLIKNSYKPARSNFYIGEINFEEKKYSKAIDYYKKSVSLYDEADYMPILLYHTAISLIETSNTEEAKKFKDVLIKKFPSSKEAILAKENLNI